MFWPVIRLWEVVIISSDRFVNGYLGRKLIIVSYGAASQGSNYRIREWIQHIAMCQLRGFRQRCGTGA
jgi:hypothetical protein